MARQVRVYEGERERGREAGSEGGSEGGREGGRERARERVRGCAYMRDCERVFVFAQQIMRQRARFRV